MGILTRDREALIKDEAVHHGRLCRCLGRTLHKREKSDADPCKSSGLDLKSFGEGSETTFQDSTTILALS